VQLTFSGDVFEWRGPAPFYFVEVPPEECADIKSVSHIVSYGWGVIPASVKIGKTEITTSLFPKQGKYLVPIKDALRSPEGISVGQTVKITLTINV
jgi:hypothetical protein